MAAPTWMSWSSGKDSAWALWTLQQREDVEVVGLLTTVTQPFDRVSMHGVRRELLEMQARSLGLPLHVVEIPNPCPNEIYERRMASVVARACDDGIAHMAFGDLFLADVRVYRERMLEGTGIEPLFPLWARPTEDLAREMIGAGLQARITCLDPTRIPRSLAGRPFDETLLAELPADVDPCAENGEFHTFCHAGPMFGRPVPVLVGETVAREGFVFTDLLPGPS